MEHAPYGGSFMVADIGGDNVVTPEDFAEEHRRVRASAETFLRSELLPAFKRVEEPDIRLTRRLLRRMGELGLLEVGLPLAGGAPGPGQVGAALLAETLGPCTSFALAALFHTDFGMLPIACYGTEDQRHAWLPEMAAGRRIAAFALSEPEAGSDALGVRTNAAVAEDGTSCVLNGSKRYIANAGIADVFLTFAKLEGRQFSAFALDRDTLASGVGPEDEMMGLRGLSVCPIRLDGVEAPRDRLLGSAGKGHRIALNAVNVGRMKLGAAALGVMKEALTLSVSHAKERKQFGKPISSFPLNASKLATMNALIYVTESMVYRTAGCLDRAFARAFGEKPGAMDEALAEFAIECSIVKVFASEALGRVADETLQLHGGAGYASGTPAERIYRDSRVFRIFEGTNEINRLRIPTTLLRRALKGGIPLLARAEEAQAELLKPLPLPPLAAEFLERETGIAAALKKTFLLAGGLALQRYGLRLEREQELVAILADLMIDAYALESACVRTVKIGREKGAEAAALGARMTAWFADEAARKAFGNARMLLAALERGESLRLQTALLRKLLHFEPIDAVAALRDTAAAVLRAGRYVCGNTEGAAETEN
ncbi:acyl-CoA dehydrogenase family protein [Cohnella caldifontis]|uniref:acyl-CoA dehydrogenase family protein n=1 Tax=Cohnella caldifontis TaxID=3027471 RepID=UPI0023EB2F70|nr:acyl-CoA dehydrogenase family protein [Cohnella sp. YIM B05605]